MCRFDAPIPLIGFLFNVERCVKSLKGGRSHGSHPILRESSIQSFLIRCVSESICKSWVKLLVPPLAIKEKFEKILRFELD